MPVRTVKVPSYLETERSIAVLRAAEPGLSDAALIRKLIDAKAAELLQAGVELNIQEPLLD